MSTPTGNNHRYGVMRPPITQQAIRSFRCPRGRGAGLKADDCTFSRSLQVPCFPSRYGKAWAKSCTIRYSMAPTSFATRA